MAQVHHQRQKRAAVQPEAHPGNATLRRYAAEIAVLAKLEERGGLLCPLCDCSMAVDPWWQTTHWLCARQHTYSNPRALYEELLGKSRIPQDLADELERSYAPPPVATPASPPAAPELASEPGEPHARGTPR